MILDTSNTRLKTEIAHSLVLTIPLSQTKPATTAIKYCWTHLTPKHKLRGLQYKKPDTLRL